MCILDVFQIYLGVSTIGFIYKECMLKYPKTVSVSRKYLCIIKLYPVLKYPKTRKSRKYLCIIKLYPVLKYPKKENLESIYVS